MIYISTDYVFEGSHPPYFPDNPTQPSNKYGQSKLEGENVVKLVPSHIVLRIPVLYGNVKHLQEHMINDDKSLVGLICELPSRMMSVQEVLSY